jgi:hypothetical protein
VDRWGNVLATNDLRSLQWITTARYNRFNQAIEQIQSEVTLATGGITRPVTRFQYDLLGRQIAQHRCQRQPQPPALQRRRPVGRAPAVSTRTSSMP